VFAFSFRKTKTKTKKGRQCLFQKNFISIYISLVCNLHFFHSLHASFFHSALTTLQTPDSQKPCTPFFKDYNSSVHLTSHQTRHIVCYHITYQLQTTYHTTKLQNQFSHKTIYTNPFFHTILLVCFTLQPNKSHYILINTPGSYSIQSPGSKLYYQTQ